MRYFFLVLLLLLLPPAARAAELRIDRPADAVRVGDTFTVTVVLLTGTDSINALGGSLHFPPPLLSLSAVRLSGSLIPLWVTAPVQTTPGLIGFAGLLPGGFQGPALVFTAVFTAREAGTAELSFGGDTALYENDGAGTPAPLSLRPLELSIGPRSGTPRTVSLVDTVPPEPFTPVFAAGGPFGMTGTVLTFSAQDKDSGVIRYDIARSYDGHANERSLSWSAVQSPYELAAGDSDRYLYVRAVDAAGNTRIATVLPERFSIAAFGRTYWLILLIALAGVILFFRPCRSRDARRAV